MKNCETLIEDMALRMQEILGGSNVTNESFSSFLKFLKFTKTKFIMLVQISEKISVIRTGFQDPTARFLCIS